MKTKQKFFQTYQAPKDLIEFKAKDKPKMIKRVRRLENMMEQRQQGLAYTEASNEELLITLHVLKALAGWPGYQTTYLNQGRAKSWRIH